MNQLLALAFDDPTYQTFDGQQINALISWLLTRDTLDLINFPGRDTPSSPNFNPVVLPPLLSPLLSDGTSAGGSAVTGVSAEGAIAVWESSLGTQFPVLVDVFVGDLPFGQLAEARVTHFDPFGRPSGGSIVIDVDGSGIGWYVDATPEDQTEFGIARTSSTFEAGPDSPAYGRYDLYTVILHELGHLAGFISGYDGFDRHVRTIGGSQVFAGADFTATLTGDGDHLSTTAHTYDLMNSTLSPSIRKLPTPLDVQIILTARDPDSAVPGAPDTASTGTSTTAGETSTTTATTDGSGAGDNPAVSSTSTTIGASQDASGESGAVTVVAGPPPKPEDEVEPDFAWTPLAAPFAGASGIVNGSFSITDPAHPDFGWTARGDAQVLAGQGVLSEHARLMSGFRQTFVVPAGASKLAFAIFLENLTPLAGAPPDAFEAALLDAVTGVSLVQTAAGLSNTDAFLNVQATGEFYFGPGMLNSAVSASGELAAFDQPIHLIVDLSGVPAGTVATLYFDLLGFGAENSSVTIDDVRLLGATPPPLAFVLDPASDSAATGDGLTRFSPVHFSGTTDPLQQVVFDFDGDGFDDGGTTADLAGRFVVTGVPLTSGPNAVRLQATSAAGATEALQIVTLDAQPPQGSLVAPSISSTITTDPGFIEVQWSDIGAAGVDATSFDISDVTVTGVTIDRFEHVADALVRYWYNDDGDALAAGPVTVTLAAGAVADRAGNTSGSQTVSFTFQDESGAPLTVEEVVVNGGAAQRSNLETIAIRFSQGTNLQALIEDARVSEAIRLSGAGTLLLEPWRFRYDASTFTLTIDLTADGFDGTRATLLADGRYQLLLDTSLIAAGSDPATKLTDDDGTDDFFRRFAFHRLAADWDGDADVDLVDRNLFFEHYGSVQGGPTYDYPFDLNGDGKIDSFDYAEWKKRYGRKL